MGAHALGSKKSAGLSRTWKRKVDACLYTYIRDVASGVDVNHEGASPSSSSMASIARQRGSPPPTALYGLHDRPTVLKCVQLRACRLRLLWRVLAAWPHCTARARLGGLPVHDNGDVRPSRRQQCAHWFNEVLQSLCAARSCRFGCIASQHHINYQE